MSKNSFNQDTKLLTQNEKIQKGNQLLIEHFETEKGKNKEEMAGQSQKSQYLNTQDKDKLVCTWKYALYFSPRATSKLHLEREKNIQMFSCKVMQKK